MGSVYGGAEEDRTPDLLRARQALSQLSYGPMSESGIVYAISLGSLPRKLLVTNGNLGPRHLTAHKLVGLGGFEPPTSPLSGVRSNQLSYRPRVL